jgi:hypothetical protein
VGVSYVYDAMGHMNQAGFKVYTSPWINK